MEINEELKAAKDVVQVFLKAKKILRMYPQNNPIYIKTLEDSSNRFRDFFHYRDSLNFKFRQNDIYYDSEVVYNNPEKDDNLALFFFKDGIRDITFKKNLTSDELEEFLKIISLDFDREVVEDDIVTLFWERDFQNIQYVVDESFLLDEEDYEEKAMNELKEKAAEPDELDKAYADAFKEADEKIKDVAVVPLTEKDLESLFKELERDASEKTEKLMGMLFELFYNSKSKEEFAEIVTFVNSAIEHSIGHGDIRLVTGVLSRFHQIKDEKTIHEDIRKEAKRIMFFAGSERIITLIGEMLDSGQEIDEKVIEDFIRFLDNNAILSFMKVLGELKSIHARKIVIDALIYLGPRDIMILAKGLSDSRWYVVRNIIFILRKIGDKRAVDHLLKMVQHGDIRVKKEVIRTLGELGGAGVLMTLRDCLSNAEVQVRTAALKALGNIGSEPAKKIIIDNISNADFKDRDFDEKKEYFEVLSKWKDKEVYNLLMRTIKKRVFWGRTKNYEKRACAAYCLGLMGNKDSLPLLNKYRNAGNKLLREFSHAAIKRIEHANK